MAGYDMRTGNIAGHMMRFAVPLVIGNFFQLTYNAVDSIVVGRCVGDAAQAAIGVANPLMNVLIFFIVGACNGIGVILSECYGAGEHERLKKEFATAAVFGTGVVLLFSALFFLLTPLLLTLISTPPEIMAQTTGYMRIIIMGLCFTFLYNVSACALRSLGDAKTPLLFLVLSSCLNIGLDVLFVVRYSFGVAGAALGTVISQAVSAFLCMAVIQSGNPYLRLGRKDLRIDARLLKRLLQYSVSTGMQKITLNVGKVLIQSFVNPLGVSAVAAFNAVNRVDDFVFQPEQSIASAMTTFVAQNRGAGEKERIRKCLWCGLLMELLYWVLIGAAVFFSAEGIMGLFTAKEGGSMAAIGTAYLRYMSFFYVMPGITNWLQGYVRGFGKMNVCLTATFVQMVGRVGAGAFLIPAYGIVGVAFSCLAGWVLMLLFEIPYCVKKKYLTPSSFYSTLSKCRE